MFIVNESQTAIVLNLGKVVRSDLKPGLHFKVPLIEQVRKFDRRLLTLDDNPERYLTVEKKDVEVDFFVKWRIKDVTVYYRATSGGNEEAAAQRLTPIIKNTLRNDIKSFASSMSLQGGRKYVILDEADYLNPNSTQPALRNFMEEYSKNCGFILTCNFKNKIIDPLHSRCSVVDFKIPAEEKPKMASLFYKRVHAILEQEGVEHEPKVVAELIKRHFPDWRRVLNELQRYSATGRIDTGILTDFSEDSFKGLIEMMKAKNFTQVRKWVAENTDIDYNVLYRKFYEQAHGMLAPGSIPQLVVTLADYQYKAAFVADQEINNAACMAEIMVGVEWK